MFYNQPITKILFATIISIFLQACSDADVQTENIASKQASIPVLDVYKRASCGCCGHWVDHIKESGFEAITHDHEDLTAFKVEHGIDARYQSCHTSLSTDGYVFEGHIPAKFIKRFLAEKPEDAIGLTVPAMPVGSPGMEVEDKFRPYKVLLLKKDGSVTTYAMVNNQIEQY